MSTPIENAENIQHPAVAVILLNWNNMADTLECLESLFASDYQNFFVIVVDNGSRINPENVMMNNFSSVKFIRNEENLGFTGGMNTGIKAGMQEGADYIWLLNNDAKVFPDTITKIVGEAEVDDKIGLVSPVVRSENFSYLGTFLDVSTQTRRNFTSIKELSTAKETTPNCICLWATALLIKTEVVKQVGLLDNSFFAYFEDMDYSMRVTTAGFKNMLCTGAVVDHREKDSALRNYPDHYHFYMVRNEYLFWMKYLNQSDKSAFRRKYISRMIKRSARYLDAKAISAANACLDGMWSALTNKCGVRTSDQVIPGLLKHIISSHPYFWSKLVSKR